MMNKETIDAILEHEGYEVTEQNGKLLLIDLVGQFIDATFNTRQELNAYVEKHIAPYTSGNECSEIARGWGL